ncbi:hypothetical protein MOV40_06535 [Bifidobacterium pseudolongum subsp. globosum]|uniref:hypothetical protein n=1 Tax=Bifidobacterium pseudolongum TaxID=1694 RepID=UPI001F53D9BC|nr:hypothetical protein [Bifidobacterium pseudolongum]MCI1195153.1 hypothetical protein [Bifidobacterium pseudolongum subsp. globosum]UNP92909.1 hypothetical protein MPY70_07895 [Bifidobacterium pseudolongum subsp. globosum]UNZ09516.1 hypothetical protein MRS62_07885 [Bifidobacterium pseudolongum subsp. globosum]
MRRPGWKTIIIYGVLPVLLLATLIAMAVVSQICGYNPMPSHPAATVSEAPAVGRTPADVCRLDAPAMLEQWRAGTLDGTDMAPGALVAERPDPMPVMDGTWSAGLLAYGDGTVTCSVLTGGDQPFTVGLRHGHGRWMVALIRVPGSERP